MKKKQLSVNNKRITYYESRDNGNTIVFVHGFSSCSSIFIRQLIDSVLSYSYRIIAVDLLGHGNAEYSDNPKADYSIKGQAEFLVNFCKSLNITDAVFAGHNIGANIILEAIDKLVNPKGLVLLSAVPFAQPFDRFLFKDSGKLEVLFKAGIDDSEVHQIAGWFVESKTSYPDFIPEVIRKADLSTREIFYNSLLNNEFNDQNLKLEALDIPIAVYCGEYDQIFDYETIKKIEFKNLWNKSVQKISDTGHIFFYENPADFNINIESFLSSVFTKI